MVLEQTIVCHLLYPHVLLQVLHEPLPPVLAAVGSLVLQGHHEYSAARHLTLVAPFGRGDCPEAETAAALSWLMAAKSLSGHCSLGLVMNFRSVCHVDPTPNSRAGR